MKQLYFCRHGESVLNAAGLYAGQRDTPLTKLGREQAKHAGKQAENFDIDLIVSSPLVRAHETAQIIAVAIDYPVNKIITNNLFKERALGSLEGKPWAFSHEDETKFPDMENKADMIERVQKALDFLRAQKADNILLVGHGTFATVLRTVLNPGQVYEELPNALIVKLL